MSAPLERFTVERREDWGVRSDLGIRRVLDPIDTEAKARASAERDGGQVVRREVIVFNGEWQDA